MQRSGVPLAAALLGLRPDIVVVSKGLTGGYVPLGAVLLGPRVIGLLADSPMAYGHTAAASPLGCAAALAVLSLLRDKDVQATMQAAETRLARMLGLWSRMFGCSSRQYGLIAAVELPLKRPLGLSERLAACGLFENAGTLLRVAPGDGRSIPVVPGFGFEEDDFGALETRGAGVLERLLLFHGRQDLMEGGR
jgi:putrescine aminotransferase